MKALGLGDFSCTDSDWMDFMIQLSDHTLITLALWVRKE